MSFGEKQIEITLPAYLTGEQKGRLKTALSQFFINRTKEKDYDSFYLEDIKGFFMQGDILYEIRTSEWDNESKTFNVQYTDAMLVSNTCDVEPSNQRSQTKQALFAPVIDKDQYYEDLKKGGVSSDQIKSFDDQLKSQLITNLLYLPICNITGKDYIVFFDRIFWFPVKEIVELVSNTNIQEERMKSLDNFGFYLFILKLSFHFCRVPEEIER